MLLETKTNTRSRARIAFATPAAPPRVADAPATWTTLPGGIIDGGEIVILAIKPSMWRPAIDAAPWLTGAVLFACLVAWFEAALPGLSVTASAQVVLLVGLARLAFGIARWIPRWHVLTNRRIIDVQGVREPAIHSCPLIDIRNTYVQNTALEKTLRVGSITFVTSHAEEPPRLWQSIPMPDEVHAEVRRAIEKAIDQYGM